MIVKVVLAAAILTAGLTAGEAVAQAAKGAQGTAELPRRRPEEAQADPMRAFDINKDGKLDLAEAKSAAAARFDELNPDQDDSMDARESRTVLRGQAFRKADTDADGTVSKAEYLAYVERAFAAADTDKDGSLDRAELRTKAGRALLALLR